MRVRSIVFSFLVSILIFSNLNWSVLAAPADSESGQDTGESSNDSGTDSTSGTQGSDISGTSVDIGGGDASGGTGDSGDGGGDDGYVPPDSSGVPVQTLTSVVSAGCNDIYPLVRYDFTASYSHNTSKFEVWRKRQGLGGWSVIRDLAVPGSYLDDRLDSNSYTATYIEYFIRRVDNTYGNLDTNHLQINVPNCSPSATPPPDAPTQTLTSAVNAGCSGNNPLVNVSFSGSSSPTTVKFEIWRWRRDLDNWSVAKEVSSPGTYTDDRLDSNSSSATYTEYFIRRVDNRFGNIDSNHTTVNVSNCSPPSPFNQNPPQASCPAQNTPRLVLSWGSSANARNYIVAYRDLSDGGGGVERIYGDVGLSLSTEVTGLTPGHSYGFLIIAQNIVGSDLVSIYSNNAWSDTVSGLGPVTYPDCTAPAIDFKLNNQTIFDPPLSVRQTTPVALTWNVTNANSCTASSNPGQNYWGGPVGLSGRVDLPSSTINTRGTYQYTLTCSNNFFSGSSTLTLNVTQLQKPYIQTTGGDVHTNESIYISQ